MSTFFINNPATKSPVSISHQEHALLLGSCFTENIGDKLKAFKFNCTTNPFGIIYNPISLALALQQIIDNKNYSKADLIAQNGRWLSLNHHGSFSSFNSETCLNNINQQITNAHSKLNQAKTIVITLGTAWVYEWNETKQLVANCHKLPAKNFTKRLLSVEEVCDAFLPVLKQLRHANVVFTISPVRHISDGLHENNISKSVLHLAVHQLLNLVDNCHYFGAYEMVIDELRDYRFFKEDMIHPSAQAIDYVWEKFSTTYFSKETQELNEKIEKIQNSVKHKPFDFESDAHQKFIAQQLATMEKLNNKHPFLNFEKEKVEIQSFPQ